MDVIPPRVYRVQNDRSYTIFSPADGFESRGHYHTGYSFWLNKRKLESHLEWDACPEESTPFISVFDNLGAAEQRALSPWQRNTGVFIAEIDTSSLHHAVLDIEFSDRVVQLPVWENVEAGVTFISTRAVRRHLQVDASVSQESEWFALDYIPSAIIRGITYY